MKKKLLFTAVVVAAMSGTMVPVLALQNPAETEAGFMADEAGDVETSVYTDITNEYVVNASCAENYGWNKDSRNASAGYTVNTPVLDSEDYKGIGVEFWTDSKGNRLTDGDLIYQDITAIPNGVYRLTACAMGRNQSNVDVCENGLYLFANESEIQVTTNMWGKYSTMVEVTDNTLRIGLRVKDGNMNNWIAISNVVLEYQGEELSFYQLALPEKMDYVHELGNQFETGRLVQKQYADKLKNYQAASCSQIEEYKNEIEAIDKLIDEANSMKTTFENVYLSSKKYAERLLAQLISDESAKSILNATIETTYSSAFESTDLEGLTEAGNTLLDACKVYYDASKGIAEETENLDMTPLVVLNPGFDNESMEGWICNVQPDLSHDMPYFAFDAWNRPTFDFYQDVELPNGLYYLSVQEHVTIGDKTDLYIQSSEGRMTTKMNWNYGGEVAAAEKDWAVDKERNRVATGSVMVVDGQVRIGVNLHTSFQGYMFFDNFRLMRVSDGAEEIKALYEQKKAEADAIDQNILFDVFKQRLVTALAMPVTTIDEYYAAYNELNKVVADCSSAEGAIMKLVDLIDECQYYYDNSQTTVEIKENFLNAINEAKTYQQLTSSEVLQEYADNLELARQAFVEHANPVNEVQFDMTYLIKNPDVTGKPKGPVSSFGWVSSTNSWSNNFNNNGDPSQFYESYQNGAFGAGTWVLYQPIHLTAGSYKMTLKAFGMNANGAGSGPLVASVYAGETKGESIIDGNTLNNTFGVNFKVSADSEMNLGVKIDEGNGANWVGANDMKLYKLAPENMTLDETATTYDVEEDMYTNVIVNRTLKADDKWNTFCVPFAMSAEQLADNHIAEVRKLENVETVGESFVLNFSEPVTEIEAGVPYIVKVDEAVNQIIANGVVVKAADPMVLTVGGVVMQGNYGSMTITGDHYFISDNKFYRAADKTVKVNGFRAYISLSGAQAAGINKMFINVDGEVTGINEAIEDLSDELVNVYTLNGVCVKSGVKISEALNGLRKGTYIVNGKKVIK